MPTRCFPVVGVTRTRKPKYSAVYSLPTSGTDAVIPQVSPRRAGPMVSAHWLRSSTIKQASLPMMAIAASEGPSSRGELLPAKMPGSYAGKLATRSRCRDACRSAVREMIVHSELHQATGASKQCYRHLIGRIDVLLNNGHGGKLVGIEP